MYSMEGKISGKSTPMRLLSRQVTPCLTPKLESRFKKRHVFDNNPEDIGPMGQERMSYADKGSPKSKTKEDNWFKKVFSEEQRSFKNSINTGLGDSKGKGLQGSFFTSHLTRQKGFLHL
jgi:hypothetical protein